MSVCVCATISTSGNTTYLNRLFNKKYTKSGLQEITINNNNLRKRDAAINNRKECSFQTFNQK